MSEERYLTAKELAEHMSVSLRTVCNWIKSTDIPFEALPGRATRPTRRFKASDVEAWLGSMVGGRKTYNPPHMGLYRYKSGKNKSDIWRYSFNIDGQRSYGSTESNDYAKAKEIYVAAYNAALDGRREPKGRLRLGEAIKGYLEWCKAENKASTYAEKLHLSRTLQRHFDAGRRLSSLDVADIEQYKIKRKSEKARRCDHPPSGATINRELTFLQGLFTWAVAWRKIVASPFHTGAIKKYREEPSEGKYLNAEQKQRLIAACGERLRPIVVTVLNTGMRLNEVRRLRWQQVNISLRVIHLIQTKSRNRAIKMGPGLVEMFKRLPKRSEYVFCHDDGRMLGPDSIWTRFKAACDAIGLAHFTFHDLRDVFATDFYQQDKDIRKLQRVLGHSSLSTTERYLATLGLDDPKEADAISEVVFTDSVRNLLGMGGAASTSKVEDAKICLSYRLN